MKPASDQAETLRAWAKKNTAASRMPAITAVSPCSGPPMLAIGGGKGGIGKTVLTANLAVALGARGRRVLAVDADLGLSNLDLALGASPERTMADMLTANVGLPDVLAPAGHNVHLLAGAVGQVELMSLGFHGRMSLLDTITEHRTAFDMVLIDMASGIGEHVVQFAQFAGRVIVVATPEPTSLADAYAFIKVLRTRCGIKEAHFVANMVRSQAEGEAL